MLILHRTSKITMLGRPLFRITVILVRYDTILSGSLAAETRPTSAVELEP
jgi:hypothetical protein